MKFYTGLGDKGTSTLLGQNKRISKNDLRFEALGASDELNSYLGICGALAKDKQIKSALLEAQENLFIIQAELGGAKNVELGENKLKDLEKMIDELGKFVGPITKFTISGGNLLSAHLDYARALARRAERSVWAAKPPLGGLAAKYLNRLSSFLFVLARYVNKKAKLKESHPSYK